MARAKLNPPLDDLARISRDVGRPVAAVLRFADRRGCDWIALRFDDGTLRLIGPAKRLRDRARVDRLLAEAGRPADLPPLGKDARRFFCSAVYRSAQRTTFREDLP